MNVSELPMIKMIAAVSRRPGMTHGEYTKYIRDVHGAIARANPMTLKRYVQNHVFDSAFGSTGERTHSQSATRDSVTELYWESLESMGQTFSHPYTQQTVGPDGANFADERTTLSLIATEDELDVPSPGTGTVKVMHFLRAKPGLDLAEFLTRWRSAHSRVLNDSPVIAAAVRRCVHSRQLPEGNQLLKYFGAESNVPYEGVVSLWFDDETQVVTFRHYEQALMAISATEATAFYNPSESFFLYVREVNIL